MGFGCRSGFADGFQTILDDFQPSIRCSDGWCISLDDKTSPSPYWKTFSALGT